MDINQAFGLALKELRVLKGKTQEDFAEVSSRTYISTLERGMKSPTIEKVDQIASELNINALSLMMLTYAKLNEKLISEMISDVEFELEKLI